VVFAYVPTSKNVKKIRHRIAASSEKEGNMLSESLCTRFQVQNLCFWTGHESRKRGRYTYIAGARTLYFNIIVLCDDGLV